MNSGVKWTMHAPANHMHPTVRREIQRVAAALRRDWDPIGGGRMPDLPADEYDSYAPRVVALFRGGADDLAVAEYLSEVERDWMGLRPRPPEQLVPTVRDIRRAAATE